MPNIYKRKTVFFWQTVKEVLQYVYTALAVSQNHSYYRHIVSGKDENEVKIWKIY